MAVPLRALPVILLVAALIPLTAADDGTSNGYPQVFISGNAVPPPYTLTADESHILVNGLQLWPPVSDEEPANREVSEITRRHHQIMSQAREKWKSHLRRDDTTPYDVFIVSVLQFLEDQPEVDDVVQKGETSLALTWKGHDVPVFVALPTREYLRSLEDREDEMAAHDRRLRFYRDHIAEGGIIFVSPRGTASFPGAGGREALKGLLEEIRSAQNGTWNGGRLRQYLVDELRNPVDRSRLIPTDVAPRSQSSDDHIPQLYIDGNPVYPPYAVETNGDRVAVSDVDTLRSSGMYLRDEPRPLSLTRRDTSLWSRICGADPSIAIQALDDALAAELVRNDAIVPELSELALQAQSVATFFAPQSDHSLELVSPELALGQDIRIDPTRDISVVIAPGSPVTFATLLDAATRDVVVVAEEMIFPQNSLLVLIGGLEDIRHTELAMRSLRAALVPVSFKLHEPPVMPTHLTTNAMAFVHLWTGISGAELRARASAAVIELMNVGPSPNAYLASGTLAGLRSLADLGSVKAVMIHSVALPPKTVTTDD